jgi:hypothetical protein
MCEPAPHPAGHPSLVLGPGLEMSIFGAVLRTFYGLVIRMIIGISAIPFQYNLTVEGGYVMKMRSTQGGDR